MIFEKKFQEFKDKFADADVSKLTDVFAMQVNMTDEDCGGVFYIAYVDGALAVEPYDYVDRTSEIVGTSTEIKKVFSARIGLAKAIAEGKVTVYGNEADIVAVQSLLKKPVAKKAAKKEAAPKKAEEKMPAKEIEKNTEKKPENKPENKLEKKPEKKAEKKTGKKK